MGYSMKYWIISADENVYDHAKAFDAWGYIDWGVKANISVGDIVYIYFKTPVKKIRYKTEVIKTDISFGDITEDDSFWLNGNVRGHKSKYARLRFIDCIDDDSLSYSNLKNHGITSTLQANEEIKNQNLIDYIERQFNFFVLGDNERIISFPCASTYDVVRKTHIHAHPVKNHPDDIPHYMMIRAKGGLSEEIYRIERQIEINPFDNKVVDSFSREPFYDDLREYISYRNSKYPFTKAPEPYRFYVLKNVYKLNPSYKLEPNIQKHKYHLFKELNQINRNAKYLDIKDILDIYHSKYSDSDIQHSLAQAAVAHRRFTSDFPKEKIESLSLDDYLISKEGGSGKDDSFCRRIRYEMDVMGHMGNVYYDAFGIYYNKGTELSLSDSLKNKFGDNYDSAFKYVKRQISELFVAFDNGNYEKIGSIDLHKSFKYRLLMIYYPNDIFPVCTESTLNGYCDHFGITYADDDEPIYRNVELVKKKNSIADIKEWTNHQTMGLIDWMWRSDIFLKNDLNQTGFYQEEDERELFFKSIHLPAGFEAKRYREMNRVHLKYNSVGFAVFDMNLKTYNLATRRKLFNAIGVNNYDLTDNLGPNHAIIKGIRYSDTDILHELINYISEHGNITKKLDTDYCISTVEVEVSEKEETFIQKELDDYIIKTDISDDDFEYEAVPEVRKEVKESDKKSNSSAYPRDPQKRVNALKRAKFTCELNSEHESFISRSTNMRYMETHHLIPLEYWKYFENSLDVEANIVCLCSNCHNEIHYGKYASNLIRPLYEKRKQELIASGIDIDIDDLIDLYDGIYIEKDNTEENYD